jgi:CIC family chloride channel protein
MQGKAQRDGPEHVMKWNSSADGGYPAGMTTVEREEIARLNLLWLSILALMLGIATGFGAVLFRDLIGLIHNLFFAGNPSVSYDANTFTAPSRWGAFVILAPVAGAVIVTFLVHNFAPEAKGPGVSEVLEAIYYREGVIRPIVALVKSLASAVAIGSGSSVGREGPIIQIGSALGSTLGQVVFMPPGQRIALVAAGAGAGIAATFNTPIGGVMFAIELMMPEVSATTFLPVAIATGAATCVGGLFFGEHPAFRAPTLTPLASDAGTVLLLALYTALGAVTGAAAAGFVQGLHITEDLFERIRWRYARHMLGMLSVGVLMYVLFQMLGQYYVDGVGYATIQSILLGQTTTSWLFGVLFISKMFATSASLGSGSSGGVFSPSLFMGATLGALFASLAVSAGAPVSLSVPAFAIVGMGAMVGGATGAVMTAVTMIFEMTRDYNIVMPMILAVAASVGVRRILSRETIYTLKLARRGRNVPKALHANMFLVRHAREVMDTDVLVLPMEHRFDVFLKEHADEKRFRHVIVTQNGRVYGVIRINMDLRRLDGGHTDVLLGDVASRDFTIVGQDTIASEVIERMWRKNAVMAVVVKGRGVPRGCDVAGVITKEHIADSVASGLNVYPPPATKRPQ